MPSQNWKITLQPDATIECWFFREQRDVQAIVQRMDENPNIEWKAQYRTTASAHQATTIAILAGQPPFYAVMTELKMTAARKNGGEGTQAAEEGEIQVTWPVNPHG